MSKHETLLRHQRIISKLRSKKEATFEEIAGYLRDQSEFLEYNLVISQRTFQREINEIRSLYNIDIRFNRSQKVYFIEEEENHDLSNRLMEAFDLISTLKMSEDLTRFIYFEKRKPLGSNHFYVLLHAVRNRYVIDLTHRKYEHSTPSKRLVEPYGLKESKGRWYLLAKEVGKEQVKTFGLDRILDFDITKRHFVLPEKYNANDDFEHCFGIINPSDAKPVEIILSFDPFEGNYIKSYPLHASQSILVDNEEEMRIGLFLIITVDFVMEILSFGENVEVIAPESLITEVRQRYENALQQYRQP